MKKAGAAKPRNLCIILLLYIICSCTNQNSINNIPILDIEAAVENPANINMSKYFSKIEYIPLETTANSLIGDVEMAKIYPAPDRVLIMNTRRGGPSTILSYDYRGKALEFKAKNGRAESEFAQGNSIVTNGSNVFLIDVNAIKVYNMDGNYIKSIPLENGFSFSNKFALIDDEIIFLKEDKKREEDFLVILDKEQNIRLEKSFGKYRYDIREEDNPSGSSEDPFKRRIDNPYIRKCNEKALLFGYGDTISSINRVDGSLAPEYIANYGKYHRKERGLEIRSLFLEAPRFTLFRIIFNRFSFPNIESKDRRVTCLFDRESGKTVKMPRYEEYDNWGFKNDLDNGMIFTPSVIYGDKMYQLVNAYQFIEYAEDCNSDAMNEVAAKLNEESNPVLVIATIK